MDGKEYVVVPKEELTNLATSLKEAVDRIFPETTAKAPKTRKTAVPTGNRRNLPWTKEEDEFIQNNPEKTTRTLARELRRSMAAVGSRRWRVFNSNKPLKRAVPTAADLKDTRTRKRRANANTPWTKEELHYLNLNHEVEAPSQIARKLGRTTKAIRTKIGKLKLHKSTPVQTKFDF